MSVEIIEPSLATLKRYGLNIEEWREILKRQNYICPICGKQPTSGRFHIEHEHQKGWKKMPPEKRKLAVRGLACFYCNRFYLSKNMTIKKASNIQRYLLDYEKRKST